MSKNINSNHSGIALVLSIVIAYAVTVLVSTIAITCGWDTESTTYEWVMTALTSLSILLSALLVGRNKQDFSFGKLLNTKKVLNDPSLFKRILYVIGICITLLMFSSPVLSYLSAWLVELGFDTGIVSYPDVSGGYLVVGVVLLAIFPAVSEELLTRGVVLSGLKKGGYVFAILMSGFLFAIMHGNPLQLIHQFILGVIFSYLVVISGSILPAIFGHFFNNFLSVIAISTMPSDMLNQPEPTLNELLNISNLIPNIVTAVVFLILLILLLRGYTNLMLDIKNTKLVTDKIHEGGDLDELKLVREIKSFKDIPRICEYLDETPVLKDSAEPKTNMLEDSTEPKNKNNRWSMWLFISIGVLGALWILNTLMGFGIIK